MNYIEGMAYELRIYLFGGILLELKFHSFNSIYWINCFNDYF